MNSAFVFPMSGQGCQGCQKDTTSVDSLASSPTASHDRQARVMPRSRGLEHLLGRRSILPIALLCLTLVGRHAPAEGVGLPRRHPDDVAVAVRFRAPHAVAERATELNVTAIGLVQGVTYRLVVLVARGGDTVYADETQITWLPGAAAHLFQRMLPPLRGGMHTLQATLLDAAADASEEAVLASMVQRLEPQDDPATHTACAGDKSMSDFSLSPAAAAAEGGVQDACNQSAQIDGAINPIPGESVLKIGCLVSSPSHGSMLALTEDLDLVGAHFAASCRMKEAACALDACRIELSIDGSPVMWRECSSAETRLEGGDRVVAVRARLGNLDPGLYDFHVGLWCVGVLRAQSTASVVVMYPDVRPDECVPKLVVSDEPWTIAVHKNQNACTADISLDQLITEGCEEGGNIYRSQYYLRKFQFPQFGTREFLYEKLDYSNPIAISEDGRRAVSISTPCHGNYQLYVEFVSTDGNERLVAAGIFDTGTRSREAKEPGPGIQRDKMKDRFAQFLSVVCAKCSRRNFECGCDLESENPSFVALQSFMERMLVASASGYEEGIKWVVVSPMGGLGNRLLQLVSGLMLALATGRGLAVDWQHLGNLNGNRMAFAYDFDPVINWPFALEVARTSSATRLLCTDAHHIDLLMKGNLREELEVYDVVYFLCGHSPHILLANPFVGASLSKAFHGRPFFFLSHFMWMGQKARQIVTNVSSLPLAQAWDGLRSLEDFSQLLRQARPRKVIGVHARICSSRPFEYFDYRTVDSRRDAKLWSSESFCKGHPDSMKDMSVCVGSLVESDSSSRGVEGPTVILWATDHDELASSLLHDLQALPEVVVVRISHANTDRRDTHPGTGLLDMLLLEEADTLVGTTSSTYSFAAHARSLAQPRYPSFRAGTRDPCGRAPGTEGGPLFYGLSHHCLLDSGRPLWHCPRQTKCLRFVMRHSFWQVSDISCIDQLYSAVSYFCTHLVCFK